MHRASRMATPLDMARRFGAAVVYDGRLAQVGNYHCTETRSTTQVQHAWTALPGVSSGGIANNTDRPSSSIR